MKNYFYGVIIMITKIRKEFSEMIPELQNVLDVIKTVFDSIMEFVEKLADIFKGAFEKE